MRGVDRKALAETLGAITLTPKIWLTPAHMDRIANTVAPMLAAARADERGRIMALADSWQAELDSGAIRGEAARYCWGLAVKEVRAAVNHPTREPEDRPGSDS